MRLTALPGRRFRANQVGLKPLRFFVALNGVMYSVFFGQQGMQRTDAFQAGMRPIVIDADSRIHDLVGFNGLGNAIVSVGPGAKTAAVQTCHIKLCLSVHHPLRHVLTQSTLGDTDTRAAQIPEISKSCLRPSQYIVVWCVGNRTINHSLYSDFTEDGHQSHTTV